MRSFLSLLVVTVLSGVVAPQSADAGLFDCFKKKSCCEPCCPEPCCVEAPSCCAPVCCAPAPVTCCAPATCCEPAPCCDPCAQPRCGLFSKMFKKLRRKKSHSCCEPTCCAPAEPSCCAPAAPSCCAPVAPSCCAPVTCCAPAGCN